MVHFPVFCESVKASIDLDCVATARLVDLENSKNPAEGFNSDTAFELKQKKYNSFMTSIQDFVIDRCNVFSDLHELKSRVSQNLITSPYSLTLLMGLGSFIMADALKKKFVEKLGLSGLLAIAFTGIWGIKNHYLPSETSQTNFHPDLFFVGLLSLATTGITIGTNQLLKNYPAFPKIVLNLMLTTTLNIGLKDAVLQYFPKPASEPLQEEKNKKNYQPSVPNVNSLNEMIPT